MSGSAPRRVGEYPVLMPTARRLLTLSRILRLLALGPQAGGVHRVDADVGAVGGVDDAAEQPLHRRRNRDAFGEEHEALAAGHARAAS